MAASTRTVRLGDVDVPRIGLGTNRLTDTRENVGFIREAVAAGLGHIDTAHLYTGGRSEQAIGAARSGLTDGPLVVATKGGFRAGQGRPEVLRAQIKESLRRLGIDSIDLYYLHRVDPETPLEESVGALREERDAGRIRHVGLSEASVEQIERARAIVPVAAVQNLHNLVERPHEDVIDHCTRLGIVFVPFYPLRESHPALASIAERQGTTPSQVTLAWLLRRSPTMLPIPGTLSIGHLRDNLAAIDLDLSDEDYSALQRTA